MRDVIDVEDSLRRSTKASKFAQVTALTTITFLADNDTPVRGSIAQKTVFISLGNWQNHNREKCKLVCSKVISSGIHCRYNFVFQREAELRAQFFESYEEPETPSLSVFRSALAYESLMLLHRVFTSSQVNEIPKGSSSTDVSLFFRPYQLK